MDLSQTKRTTIERPAAPPGLDPNPQRVVPSGGAAREAAAGTLGSISGFPLKPAEGLPGLRHGRAQSGYSLSVGKRKK